MSLQQLKRVIADKLVVSSKAKVQVILFVNIYTHSVSVLRWVWV